MKINEQSFRISFLDIQYPGKEMGEFHKYETLRAFFLDVCWRHAYIHYEIMDVPRGGKEMYLYHFLPKNSVRILEENIAPKLLQKLIAINKIPLSTPQEEMSQDEFNSILQVMKQDLEEAGVERNLINLCEKNIFSQS